MESALVNTVPIHLRSARVGASYEVELTATGGQPPYSWRIHGGTLPPGFAVSDGRVAAALVPPFAATRFRVRVTDANGRYADADTSLGPADAQETIEAVRTRGVFLFEAALNVVAVIVLLVIIRLCFSLEAFVVGQASQLRLAAGMPPPVGRADWYLLAAIALTPLAVVASLMVGLVWYRRAWSRKLASVWGPSAAVRRLARIEPLPDRCGADHCPHCQQKTRYLRELLCSPAWQSRWPALSALAHIDDQHPSTLSTQQYRAASEALFVTLEKHISERAVTTGLLVGVGRNHWLDSVTIAAAAFEMQMFVLTSLGKRPGVRLWLRMLHRCSASLFLNAYLNRQDVFALNVLIKRSAWGLHAAAASVDWASGHVDHAVQQHVDALHEHASTITDHGDPFDSSDADSDEFLHAAGNVVQLASSLFVFGLSVGSVALNQIAVFVENWSNALVQGSLSGGILYWHGCNLAAEVLALNQEHRQSPAFRRTVLDGAQRMAGQAGEILRVATRQLRAMYRERRMNVLKTVASKETMESVAKNIVTWVKGR